MGCSPWGRTESDTTEATWQQEQVELVLLQPWIRFNGLFHIFHLGIISGQFAILLTL